MGWRRGRRRRGRGARGGAARGGTGRGAGRRGRAGRGSGAGPSGRRRRSPTRPPKPRRRVTPIRSGPPTARDSVGPAAAGHLARSDLVEAVARRDDRRIRDPSPLRAVLIRSEVTDSSWNLISQRGAAGVVDRELEADRPVRERRQDDEDQAGDRDEEREGKNQRRLPMTSNTRACLAGAGPARRPGEELVLARPPTGAPCARSPGGPRRAGSSG